MRFDILKFFLSLEMILNWKVFYNVLILRLTLGIDNLMSSHSLSAGHVPLGTGRDTL